MKVGLNATCLNDRPSGARQRFVGIYGALVQQLPEVEFVVFEPVDCRVGNWFVNAPNVSFRQTPLPSEGRWQRLADGFGYWRKAFAQERFDLFEGFNLPLVHCPHGQTVLTIHDIRGVNPDTPFFEHIAFNLTLRKSLGAADHVITVSEAMKSDILAFRTDTRVSVVHNGLEPLLFDFVTKSDLQVMRQKFALPQEFLLAVGHFERRKNYMRLIDAMAHLRERGSVCNLVIIGNDSGERLQIEKKIASLNLSGNIRILSGLSDLEVRSAYKLCSLFVFPSAYEGFGIPILEAMAAGVPMVLSDIPVFREITQNKGVYFPNNDSVRMADAIENMLGSKNKRNQLIEYGYQRVRDFRFPALASQIKYLYQSLM